MPTPTFVVALPTLSLFPIRRFLAGDIYVWVAYARVFQTSTA